MTIYYVDKTSGSDSNAGTSGSPVATINKGVSLATAAGDVVRVKKAGSAYAETVNITSANSAAAGSITAPCVLEGYETTPGDGGQPTINGAGTRATCITIDRTGWGIKNFILTQPTARCIDGTAAINILMDRVSCLSNGATPAGFVSSSAFTLLVLRAQRCVFDGATSATLLYGQTDFLDCDFRNAAMPITFPASTARFGFRKCRFYNFSGNCIVAAGSNPQINIEQCSFDGIGGDAIDLSATTNSDFRIAENVFANVNGASKVCLRAGQQRMAWCGFNAFFNCTAQYAGGIASEGGDIALPGLPWTGGGDFTANGNSKLLKNTGLAGHDIGGRGIVDTEYPIPITIAL